MANPNPNKETRFKEGQSGNPAGRVPKGYSITETIREMMGERPEIKKALGTKVIDAALKGDMAAIKLIWSYMDGMPIQQTDVTIKEKPEPILPNPDVSNNDSPPENTEPK
jgi:hypothetical protein